MRTQREIERALKFVKFRLAESSCESAADVLCGAKAAMEWVLGDDSLAHLIQPDAARAKYGDVIYPSAVEDALEVVQ